MNKCCTAIITISLLLSTTLTNYLIQRIIKLSYQNNVNLSDQTFNSPVSIIFFVSGIIWICGSVYQFCAQKSMWKDQKNQKSFPDQNKTLEMNYDRVNFMQSQKQQTSKTKSQITQPCHFNESLPALLSIFQVAKVTIPTFLELVYFVYGIQYLSFAKVMIFKMISRLGLTTMYQSLFSENSINLTQILLSVVSFGGFALFNYFFVDDPKLEQEEKLYKDNPIYGYMFVIGMCYLGLIKNIFEKQINENYAQWRGPDFIVSQAKTNCVLSYLTLVWFNQEIYASVFAVLHSQFLLHLLGLAWLIIAALLAKTWLYYHHTDRFVSFVSNLQKGLSLIVSILLFGQGINLGQIFGVSTLVIAAIIHFCLKLSEKQVTNSNFRQIIPIQNDSTLQNLKKQSSTIDQLQITQKI